MTKINHISLAVKFPKRAATILAELTDGRAHPFMQKIGMDAWICLWNEEKNELIEFLPHGWLLQSEKQGATFNNIGSTFNYNPTHIQLEVTKPLADIKLIANKYSCHQYFRTDKNRGGPLYEIWIEDDFLVELVSDEITNNVA